MFGSGEVFVLEFAVGLLLMDICHIVYPRWVQFFNIKKENKKAK
tara:strand:+ start:929 stop:1060 length:132 start_codon:yes stop_codon:yes gene_type:complete